MNLILKFMNKFKNKFINIFYKFQIIKYYQKQCIFNINFLLLFLFNYKLNIKIYYNNILIIIKNTFFEKHYD